MELAVGVGPLDLAQEGEEVVAGVARPGLGRDLAGADLERREQAGRAVALVVVGVALDLPGRSGSIGWVRSSAWIWVFSSRLSTIARSGGSRYSPTTSRTFASRAGSVLNLKVSIRWGLRPASAQMRWIVVVLIPVRSGHPAGAPVGRPVGRRLEGEGDDPVALGPPVGRGTSRARGIVARPARPLPGEAAPPQQDRHLVDARPRRRSARSAMPSAAARTTRARIASRCSVVRARTSARSASRSDSSIASGAAGWFGMAPSVAAIGRSV